MLSFPDVPRSASKARAVIETVNEWLDGPALSVEPPEDGWGHYLLEKARNGTQPTAVFLCYWKCAFLHRRGIVQRISIISVFKLIPAHESERMDSRKFIGGFEINSAPSRPLLGRLKQWREGFRSASRFFSMPFS